MAMAQHTHKFTIGDDAAVHALSNKLTKNGKQAGRAKLLRALDDAARHYEVYVIRIFELEGQF
jgi:hypothetical protein